MSERVLLVDDDRRVLDGYRRALRGSYDLVLADGARQAMARLDEHAFAVVVTDLQMPGMDGIELLTIVRDRCPDAVRIMLTGQADLQASIEAVNQGRVFRFLTKPCPPEDLAAALEAALDQHRLRLAERQLLEGTLHGAVDVLGEVIGLADRRLHQHSLQVSSLVSSMIDVLRVDDPWEFALAAKLCSLGALTLPAQVKDRMITGEPLDADEQRMADRHPEAAFHLLERIPRLERVAAMIRGHRDPPAAATLQPATPEERIALGAWLLYVATEFDLLAWRGMRRTNALSTLRARRGGDGVLDALVDALEVAAPAAVTWSRRSVPLADLDTTMVVDEPVLSAGGVLLVHEGQRVTVALLERMRAFQAGTGIAEPIAVRVPLRD